MSRLDRLREAVSLISSVVGTQPQYVEITVRLKNEESLNNCKTYLAEEVSQLPNMVKTEDVDIEGVSIIHFTEGRIAFEQI